MYRREVKENADQKQLVSVVIYHAGRRKASYAFFFLLFYTKAERNGTATVTHGAKVTRVSHKYGKYSRLSVNY